MTTEELQQLARQFGSVVVLKDDKPSFVFLTFEKYKNLLGDEEKEVAVSHFSSQDPEYPRTSQDSKHPRTGRGPEYPRTGISFDSPNGLSLSKSEHAEGLEHPRRVETLNTPEKEVMEKLNQEVMALKDEVRMKEEQEPY